MWNYNKFLLKFIQSLGEISNQLKHEHEMHQNVYYIILSVETELPTDSTLNLMYLITSSQHGMVHYKIVDHV